MTSITIDDIDDYLTDEDIIDMVNRRRLRNRLTYGPADPNIDMGPAAHWHDLASELRDAARTSDRTHFEILLLRMTDMAGVPRASGPRSKLFDGALSH